MIFRPRKPHWLWDTWLFEWQGQFHLFYLETQQTCWDHVGHAISNDMVHWQQCPSIYTKGESGKWNEEPTLTGMVVAHDSKFYMYVGATWNKVQVVGVYVSDDLYNWRPYADNPVMMPETPYYMVPGESADWRDPCISYRKEDGFYHALLCARQSNYAHNNTGAAIAHLRSRDLLNWERLPLVNADLSGFYHTEVPDIFNLNGKYYLLFSTVSFGGLKLETPSREIASGTFYMIGESIDGPFNLSQEYLLIGSTNSKIGPYVGRTIPYRNGILLYHHVRSKERPAFCVPKKVIVREDHSLYLQYMPWMEQLETSLIVASVDDAVIFVNDFGLWQCKDNFISGIAKKMGTGCIVAENVADAHFYCKLKSLTAAKAGIALRCAENAGVLIALDFANGHISIGCACYNRVTGWGYDIDASDVCKRRLDCNKTYELRCFARNEFFEVYINDEWIFTVTLDNALKSGDVHLFVEKGEAVFANLRVAAIEALD